MASRTFTSEGKLTADYRFFLDPPDGTDQERIGYALTALAEIRRTIEDRWPWIEMAVFKGVADGA